MTPLVATADRLRGGNRGKSDADQVASDRDRSLLASSEVPPEDAFETSEDGRARGTAERAAATEKRTHTSFERAGDATRRDQHAALRDDQAAERDRTAGRRDRTAEEDERVLDRAGSFSSEARAMAAVARARAAEDRARAAEDRDHAAEDRGLARIDLEMSQLDDLTGFYRLGLGTAVLQREIDRSRRNDNDLALVYVDVDGLKRVNDELGHAAGDALLMNVADAIRSRLRSYDPVVRVGGDEFVCALPGVGLEQAREIFQDVQDALTEGLAGATVSFGLAALGPDDDLAMLLERSDHALRDSRSDTR